MNLIHVFILSLIEGLTEFLPISSTGHLILVSKLLGIGETNFVKTFEIVIQLGAILAVVVLYAKKVIMDFGLIKKILVAFVPTVIVGFFLYPLIKNVFLGNLAITLSALFWGGIVLILVELFFRKKNTDRDSKVDYDQVTYKKALIIGSFQCLSVVPGVSRAAATIVGGLSTGLNRSTATEFSFLLAVPTMFAATALDLYKSKDLITQAGSLSLFAGTVLSFFFAAIAVKFLIGYVKKHDFTFFGIYRIILSVLFWLLVR